MPMVSYQTFTKLAFAVAEAKGGSFEGINDGAQFTQQIAAVWNQNKEEWKQMTEDQARSRLQSIVSA